MKIWNKRRPFPAEAQLVDRTTPFGNPFRMEGDTDLARAASIGTYSAWIRQPEQAGLRQLMRDTLAGQDLVCWCVPKPCHAEIIMEIANTTEEEFLNGAGA